MLLPPPSPDSSAIVGPLGSTRTAAVDVPRRAALGAAWAQHAAFHSRDFDDFTARVWHRLAMADDALTAAAALAEAQITSAETAAQQAASAAARTRRAKESTSSWGAAIDGFAMSLAHASGDTLRSFAEGLISTPADAGAASESEEEEEESSPEPKPWGWEFRVTLPGGASQPDAPDEPEAAAATEPPTPPVSPTPPASPTPLSPPSPAAAEIEPSPPTTPPQTPPSRRAFTVLGRSPRADDPASAGPTLLSLGNFQLQLGAPEPTNDELASLAAAAADWGEPEPAEAAPRADEPAPAAEPPSDRPWWAIGAERHLAGWCAPTPRADEPGASKGVKRTPLLSLGGVGLCLELDPPPQPPTAAAPPPTLEALEAMDVRALVALLRERRVGTAGCIEKADLVQRAAEALHAS